MSGGTIFAFWGVSILFVITPGADWAYAISAGMAKRTSPAVLGMLTGHLIATAVVAAGVGGLVARLPATLTVLTVAGSIYLVWLGISTLRHPAGVQPSDVATAGSPWMWWTKGLGVSGLNPKVFLLFVAILPQFVDGGADWPLALQIVLLGLVHAASCAAVYFLVGYGADTLLRSRPAAARIVGRVSGTAMIVIGLFLLTERLILQ